VRDGRPGLRHRARAGARRRMTASEFLDGAGLLTGVLYLIYDAPRWSRGC
jgi:hypothetical protein